jgi:hypothetical protein
MSMQTVWPPALDSIFGDTYGGVPNPMVPHRHPWPTRYHGPIFTVPGTAKPTYRQRPYAKAPYMGVGAVPRTENVVGGGLLDAVAGVGVGYLVAPSEKNRVVWMIGGAVAGYAAGLLGVLGTGVAGVVMKK